MNFPQDVKYAKTHEWIKEDGDFIYIGLTDFAQDQLGILYLSIFRRWEIPFPKETPSQISNR